MQCGLQRTKTEASGSCVPRIKRRVFERVLVREGSMYVPVPRSSVSPREQR